MTTFYIPDSGSKTLDRLHRAIAQSAEEEIQFICPVEIFAASGPAYWLRKEKGFRALFPHKRLIFWYDVGDKGGYALGALRMGIRHVIFTGSEKTFRKIKDIAQQYHATIIPAPP